MRSEEAYINRNYLESEEKFRELIKAAWADYGDDYDESMYRPVDYSFINKMPEQLIGRRRMPTGKAVLRAIAGILIFCIAVVGTAVWINSTPANAERLKKVFHMLTNGMFTSDNEENHEAFLNESANVFRIETMDDLYKAKRFLPELLVSQTVPEDFKFQSLEITKYLNENYIVQYDYASGSRSIRISMKMVVGENAVTPENMNIIEENGLLMWEDPDSNGVGATKGNVLITITGDISVNEMFDIVKNLE